MSASKPAPAPEQPLKSARNFLGYAFVISFFIHLLTVPFFHLKEHSEDKPEVEKVSVTHKIVIKPTPRPTPTPPPPTPPPKATPPPVKQTAPPPVAKLKIQPPKTTTKSKSASSETKYVAPPVGSDNGVPQGNAATGAPAPVVATAPPATPAPTPVPTPTPTPKPQCAVPNADATTVNAVAPDYPDIARQQGAVGTTKVKVTLDASGHVLDASVAKSAGNVALDQAAIRAAKASSFSPEVVNCIKTAGSYLFSADFTGN